jgi:hypothetical protein
MDQHQFLLSFLLGPIDLKGVSGWKSGWKTETFPAKNEALNFVYHFTLPLNSGFTTIADACHSYLRAGCVAKPSYTSRKWIRVKSDVSPRSHTESTNRLGKRKKQAASYTRTGNRGGNSSRAFY